MPQWLVASQQALQQRVKQPNEMPKCSFADRRQISKRTVLQGRVNKGELNYAEKLRFLMSTEQQEVGYTTNKTKQA